MDGLNTVLVKLFLQDSDWTLRFVHFVNSDVLVSGSYDKEHT